MKNLAIVIILVLTSYMVNAQSWQVEWEYFSEDPTGYGFGYPFDVSADSLGNVYYLGEFDWYPYFPGFGFIYEQGYILIKFDSLGNYLWHIKIGNSSSFCRNMIMDDSLNVYLPTVYHNTCIIENDTFINQNPSSGQEDILILKYDSDGNYKWGRTWHGNSKDIPYNLTISNSGFIYCTGYFTSDSIPFETGTLHVDPFYTPFCLKMRTSGELIWAIVVDSLEYSCTDVEVNSNSDVFLLSYENLVKLDSAGNQQWKKNYPGVILEEISINENDQMFIVGLFYDTAMFGNNMLIANTPYAIINYGNPNATCADVFHARIDSFGNPVWVSNYYSGYHHDNNYFPINFDAEGNLVFFSLLTDSIVLDSITLYDYYYGGLHTGCVFKIDVDGNYVSAEILEIWENLWETQAFYVSENDKLYFGGGMTNYSISVAVFEKVPYQHIPLSKGWSIISMHFVPEFSTIAPFINNFYYDFIMLKNNSGDVYWPQYGISGFSSFTIGQAYQLKMLKANDMYVYGDLIIPDSVNIAYPAGWNLMAYLLEDEATANEYLSSILTDVIIAKCDEGEIFWPAYGINTIGNMKPGEGYQVKLSNNVTYTCPLQGGTK